MPKELHMPDRAARTLYLVLFLLATLAAFPARAADPLFVNLTSDDSHRAYMALAFSQKVLEAGHAVTVFLNVDAVKIAAKKAAKHKDNQALLSALMKGGATVLACPHCVEHAGMKQGDLLDGVRMGTPELTQGALFEANTRSLSW
jgi:predicted peroxiredoxin